MIKYKLILTLLSLAVVLALSSNSVLADSRIESIAFCQDYCYILEDVPINVVIVNDYNEVVEEILDIEITKDGEIREELSFTFKINANGRVTISPTFRPNEIGEYIIVAHLHDKYRAVEHDSRIVPIEVVSEIGPFDLELDVIPRTVRPNEEVPVIIKIKNVGVKGSDVKISINMDCLNEDDIYKEFLIFSGGKETTYQSSSIRACDEEGRRDITAKLMIFEGTFAQSLNQILLNRTLPDFEITAPKITRIRKGESQLVGVTVENTGDTELKNLRLVIEDIPFTWFNVKPPSIKQLVPGEYAIFIVNISVPEDAQVFEYPATISVGADEALVRKESTLSIVSGEFSEPEQTDYISIVIENEHLILAIVISATALIIFILHRKTKKSKVRVHKKEALNKIKDIIK